MKVKKFNELNEGGHLIDAEPDENFNGLKERMQEDIEQRLYEISFDLEDYTTNVEGQIKFDGVITSEYGDYNYTLTIKRTV